MALSPSSEPGQLVLPIHFEQLLTTDSRSLLIEHDLSAESLGVLAQDRETVARNPDIARAVLRDLSSAISVLHAAGLLHLNLRPESVQVDRRGRASLGGLSRAVIASNVGVSTVRYQLHGYAAPELDYGFAVRQSDFWSLGVLMYELLTGRHPCGHDGHSMNDSAFNRWKQERHRIDFEVVPTQWRRLLRGFLTHDSDARWGASEVDAFLRNADLPPPPAEFPDSLTGLSLFKLTPDDETGVRTPEALAEQLATQWSSARGIVGTARISRWLKEDRLHEEMAANVEAVEGTVDQSLDLRLLRIITELAPLHPRTYMGYALQTRDDIHALAVSAVRVSESPSVAGSILPTAVVQSLYEDRILARFPPPGDDAAAITEIDALWRQEAAEYERLRALAGSVAAELAPGSDGVDTLSFLLACLTGAEFLERARSALRRRDLARETPWFSELSGDVRDASPARLWLLQSLVGQAEAEAQANQEARRRAEIAARQAERLARQAQRDALVGRILALLAGIPGAVIGAGLGLLGGFVVAMLVYLITLFGAWVYSWFVDWDTSNIANTVGFYTALFSLVAGALAGAWAAVVAVAARDGVAARTGVLLGIVLVAGIVGWIGWLKQEYVLDSVEGIRGSFAWNKGWDCGDSGFVILTTGESRCSFNVETGGRVSFDGQLIGNSLTIPAAGGAAVSPSKITVYLTEAPGGRYVLLDAVRDQNSARYVLDKEANRAILVASHATSAGKYTWSPDGHSIASLIARGNDGYVEAYRLTDGQSARKVVPTEGRLVGHRWKDNRTFETTICRSPPAHNPNECRTFLLSLPLERRGGSGGGAPAYTGPDNVKVGDRLKVSGNEVNVRAGPSTSSAPIGRRHKGDVGALMRPPVVAGSIHWYRLRFRDGLDGWVAGRYLVKTTTEEW